MGNKILTELWAHVKSSDHKDQQTEVVILPSIPVPKSKLVRTQQAITDDPPPPIQSHV